MDITLVKNIVSTFPYTSGIFLICGVMLLIIFLKYLFDNIRDKYVVRTDKHSIYVYLALFFFITLLIDLSNYSIWYASINIPPKILPFTKVVVAFFIAILLFMDLRRLIHEHKPHILQHKVISKFLSKVLINKNPTTIISNCMEIENKLYEPNKLSFSIRAWHIVFLICLLPISISLLPNDSSITAGSFTINKSTSHQDIQNDEKIYQSYNEAKNPLNKVYKVDDLKSSATARAFIKYYRPIIYKDELLDALLEEEYTGSKADLLSISKRPIFSLYDSLIKNIGDCLTLAHKFHVDKHRLAPSLQSIALNLEELYSINSRNTSKITKPKADEVREKINKEYEAISDIVNKYIFQIEGKGEKNNCITEGEILDVGFTNIFLEESLYNSHYVDLVVMLLWVSEDYDKGIYTYEKYIKNSTKNSANYYRIKHGLHLSSARYHATNKDAYLLQLRDNEFNYAKKRYDFLNSLNQPDSFILTRLGLDDLSIKTEKYTKTGLKKRYRKMMLVAQRNKLWTLLDTRDEDINRPVDKVKLIKSILNDYSDVTRSDSNDFEHTRNLTVAGAGLLTYGVKNKDYGLIKESNKLLRDAYSHAKDIFIKSNGEFQTISSYLRNSEYFLLYAKQEYKDKTK